MEYVNIPGTDLSASRIGLGTWAIGGWMWDGTDEELSIRTICAALERGVTLIDTAEQPGVQVSLWGARTPQHLAPLDEVLGWSLDGEAHRQIDAILRETVRDPVGPEVMAPPAVGEAGERERLTA